MTSHPYISGPGSVAQMIGYLRKSFPQSVTSETVKKFGLAPNNESYVINALQFIGVIDEEGKRTTNGHDAFVLGNDQFPKAFEGLIRESYKDLFEVRGEDTGTLTRSELVTYFRSTDKTSEVIGGRQAGLFQTFRVIAGYQQQSEKIASNGAAKPKVVKQKSVAQSKSTSSKAHSTIEKDVTDHKRKSGQAMAMTVRIEINLPANGTQETYDAIFKSIKANLYP